MILPFPRFTLPRLRFPIRAAAPIPTAPQKDPAVALALWEAWEALCSNPETAGTPEEHAAYLQVTLYDVAHLSGPLSRLSPSTRPEVRP